MSEYRKACSNCEGEGLVGIWGYYGHEVPASRRDRYPSDWPNGDPRAGVSPVYQCPVCKGKGQLREDGTRIRDEEVQS